MRKLKFAVCLAVSSAVTVPSGEASAAVLRSTTKSSQKNSARGKSATPARHKVYAPADLWARLREGMSLARPLPVELPPPPTPPAMDPFPGTVPSGDPTSDALVSTIEDIPTVDAERLLQGRAKVTRTEPVPETPARRGRSADSTSEAQRPFTIDEIIEERRLAYQRKLEDYQRQLAEYEDLKRQQAIHELFQTHLSWYSERVGFVRQSVQRARPFLHLIVEELDRRKLPFDLALLPILESGYKLRAESPKEASGIWQFIPGTGQLYGLPLTERYDGRLDVPRATRAAANYLAHLNRRFKGDWLLALASYNCGEGRVEQAIAANRENDLPTDFWALQLPEETKAYVPRLLALAEMFARPEEYRLNLQPLPNQRYLAPIRLEQPLPAEEVARLADLSVDRFLYLNPGFIQGTVGIEEANEILLPAHHVAGFVRRLAAFLNPPDPTREVFAFADEIEPRSDAVLFGEPRPATFRSAAATVSTVNGQTPDRAPLGTGTTTPSGAGASRDTHAETSTGTAHAPGFETARSIPDAAGTDVVHVHSVVPGETIERIAGYYGLDAATLRGHNKLKGKKRIQPGDSLVIPLEQAVPLDLLPAEADRFAHPAVAASTNRAEPAPAPQTNGCQQNC
ncbi:MAG: transglycosylase SLT domain-containing protein [Methylotetracoccus sp.]